MAYRSTHCKTQLCHDSANTMCEHEQVLTAQYLLDQYKLHALFFSRKQENARHGTAQLNLTQPARSCSSNMQKKKETVVVSINELYLTPCTTASFGNSLSCTNSKCCSFSHQIFANHTRAGTGRIHS